MKKIVLAMAALALAAPGAANASITLFTNQADYLAAISAPGIDTFNDLPGSSVASPLVRTAGAYGYTAAVSTTNFFPAGSAGDRWLSTNTATDSILFSNFTGGVFGFGGFFFDSEINGSFASGNISVSATDADGTVSHLISSATTSSFLGFVSNTGVTGAQVTSVQPAGGFLWPTVNNLTLGGQATAAPVPEPDTWALMIVGFGLVGASLRKTKRKVAFRYAAA